MIRRTEKGFTLVELLIVVAIIGILAGVVLIAINPGETLKKSRDATRLSDLDSVARALNLALAEEVITLQSNAGSTSTAGNTGVDGSGWVDVLPLPAGTVGLGKYISALPLPPNHDTEAYSYASDGDYYELNAVLEATANATKMENDGGNNDAVYELGTAPGLDLLN